MMARLLVLLAVLAGAAAKHMLNVAEHGVCAAVNRSRACQIDSDGDVKVSVPLGPACDDGAAIVSLAPLPPAPRSEWNTRSQRTNWKRSHLWCLGFRYSTTG